MSDKVLVNYLPKADIIRVYDCRTIDKNLKKGLLREKDSFSLKEQFFNKKGRVDSPIF